MKFQLRVVEPVSQLRDLRPVPVIQMLPRKEDLDQRDTGIPNPVEPDRSQPVIDEEVCRECAFHLVSRRGAGPAPVSAALQPTIVVHDGFDAGRHLRRFVVYIIPTGL